MTEHGHGHAHGHGGHFDAERVAAALEVEAELAAGVADAAIALCVQRLAASGSTVRRVVDLGCGPGVDTTRLAAAFPSATVIAADASMTMLARVGVRAARLGVADRVQTVTIDLDGPLDALGSCDLAWAAMAVHHATDELATLRRIRSLLRPDGLLCLLERADPPVVRLADDLGRPNIWDGLATARSASPTAPDAWPGRLASAGFAVLDARTLADTVTVTSLGDPATREFLAAQLRATARDLAEPADAEALTAIDDARWAGGATVTSSRRLHLCARR